MMADPEIDLMSFLPLCIQSLDAVIPYAESRAEDMYELAEENERAYIYWQNASLSVDLDKGTLELLRGISGVKKGPCWASRKREVVVGSLVLH